MLVHWQGLEHLVNSTVQKQLLLSLVKDKADQDNTTITEVETAIRATVKDVVNQNKAATSSILIDDGDIEIGTWDGGTKVFTLNATPPDAVRVRTRRDSHDQWSYQDLSWKHFWSS